MNDSFIAKAIGLGVLCVLLLIASCTFTTHVEPGHVGISINQMGSGVSQTPLEPGWHTRNPMTTTIKEYPVYMQTMALTSDEKDKSAVGGPVQVNSIEGQPVDFDISMSYDLVPAKVPHLYTEFRSDIGVIESSFMVRIVRSAMQDVVGQDSIAAILGPKKESVRSATEKKVRTALDPYGITVRQFSLTKVHGPEAILAAITAKNTMQQQAEQRKNQLEMQKYEASGDSIKAAGHAKATLAEAEAQAKANTLLAASLTPNLVAYRQLEVSLKAVDKWNGDVPTWTGGSGTAIPFINVTPPVKKEK